MNAQLQITRGPHVIGFARGARVTMDGADIANVGVGKTVTLEVPPGKHVLTAWLGGNPSAQNTIDFVPGETVHLECRMKMVLSPTQRFQAPSCSFEAQRSKFKVRG
jgi:hypothetical protein